GKNALRWNAANGDCLREAHFRKVAFFKDNMAIGGFETAGGFFPVQTITGLNDKQTRLMHAALWKKGIRTVPVLAHGRSPKLCWLFNAHQTHEGIERACRSFFVLTRDSSFLNNYD